MFVFRKTQKKSPLGMEIYLKTRKIDSLKILHFLGKIGHIVYYGRYFLTFFYEKKYESPGKDVVRQKS